MYEDVFRLGGEPSDNNTFEKLIELYQRLKMDWVLRAEGGQKELLFKGERIENE